MQACISEIAQIALAHDVFLDSSSSSLVFGHHTHVYQTTDVWIGKITAPTTSNSRN